MGSGGEGSVPGGIGRFFLNPPSRWAGVGAGAAPRSMANRAEKPPRPYHLIRYAVAACAYTSTAQATPTQRLRQSDRTIFPVCLWQTTRFAMRLPLVLAGTRRPLRRLPPPGGRTRLEPRPLGPNPDPWPPRTHTPTRTRKSPPLLRSLLQQIGRASCRERV